MDHAHAAGTAGTGTGPVMGHGALPQSMIYNMPQVLPPAYFHRGGAPLTPSANGGIARGGNSSPAFKAGEGVDAEGRPLQNIRPRSLNGLSGLNTAHTVSFSESVCDSPGTVQSSVNTFDPSESGLTPVPTPKGPGDAQGTLSNSASMEGLDESGRERASTSTTITGAHNDTVTNDTDSRAGRIDVERADSDMPLHTAGGASARFSRRGTAAYAEYEQPFENVVSDGEEDEEYAQEMAYLLEQVPFSCSTYARFCMLHNRFVCEM
jgi:hypothetical protein